MRKSIFEVLGTAGRIYKNISQEEGEKGLLLLNEYAKEEDAWAYIKREEGDVWIDIGERVKGDIEDAFRPAQSVKVSLFEIEKFIISNENYKSAEITFYHIHPYNPRFYKNIKKTIRERLQNKKITKEEARKMEEVLRSAVPSCSDIISHNYYKRILERKYPKLKVNPSRVVTLAGIFEYSARVDKSDEETYREWLDAIKTYLVPTSGVGDLNKFIEALNSKGYYLKFTPKDNIEDKNLNKIEI